MESIQGCSSEIPKKYTWLHYENEDVHYCRHINFPKERTLVASFSLFGTILKTRSGNIFPNNLNDWTIWDDDVMPALYGVGEMDFKIVIFTDYRALNLKHGKQLLTSVQRSVEAIMDYIGIPLEIYISMKDNYYNKPAPGVWELMMKKNSNVCTSKSFFVGNACGRPAGWREGAEADLSAFDLLFARNNNLKFFTAEEYILLRPSENHRHIKFHPGNFSGCSLYYPYISFPSESNEVIIMVGSHSSGKTHYLRNQLLLRQYHVVDRDIFRTLEKRIKALIDLLNLKKCVVIDDVNKDREARYRYIQVCQEMKVSVRCFFMRTSLLRCLHNNQYRMAVDSSYEAIDSRVIIEYHFSVQRPSRREGFLAIVGIPFVPSFSKPSDKAKYLCNFVDLSLQ